MDERKLNFLKAVLGEDGARALQKAAERSEDLGNAIVPRAILSWLGIVGRADYEGDVPGVDNTYLHFAKHESLYDGSIAIGDEVYTFDNASVYHVASAVAVSIGADLAPAQTLRDADIARLGKSIDLLAKARAATEELLSRKMVKVDKPGNAAQPIGPASPEAPQATQPKPGATTPGMTGTPIGGAGGKPGKPSKPKLPKPTLRIAKSQMNARCPMCAMRQFRNGAFTGCFCFRELSKSVRVLEKGEEVTLEFGAGWDADAIQTLVESLERK